MKIALIGYGKMGQAIEDAALSRGHEIVAKIDQKSNDSDWSAIADADVAIEFTAPQAAVQNIQYCFDRKVPVVVGTTGWYDDFPELKARVEKENLSILTATNFSIGVNLFFEINKMLAELMNEQDSYDVSIEEVHHKQKLDAPSGTAISLATQVLERLQRKHSWKLDESEDEHVAQDSTLRVRAYREEGVPGTHSVTYRSAIDDIEIKHTAHSRAGFAFGAVIAAEWLNNKSGVFTMQDVIKDHK